MDKLLKLYDEYLKNNNLEKALEIMEEIARLKTRTIDLDWIDIIKEFNRRLDYDRAIQGYSMAYDNSDKIQEICDDILKEIEVLNNDKK